MNPSEALSQAAMLSALRVQLANLEETIGTLHKLTLRVPLDHPLWDEVRDADSCLDSRIALREMQQGKGVTDSMTPPLPPQLAPEAVLAWTLTLLRGSYTNLSIASLHSA